MPNWLKRSTLLLSVILGFFTWFALVLIWTYSAPGGLADRVISAFLGPVFRACVRIGSLVLPDYQAPHSTGWYLASPSICHSGTSRSADLYLVFVHSHQARAST